MHQYPGQTVHLSSSFLEPNLHAVLNLASCDLCDQGHRRNLDKKKWGALTMASAEHEPIKGFEDRAPSGVQGRARDQGVRGLCPPEAESFLRIRHPKEGGN